MTKTKTTVENLTKLNPVTFRRISCNNNIDYAPAATALGKKMRDAAKEGLFDITVDSTEIPNLLLGQLGHWGFVLVHNPPMGRQLQATITINWA